MKKVMQLPHTTKLTLSLHPLVNTIIDETTQEIITEAYRVYHCQFLIFDEMELTVRNVYAADGYKVIAALYYELGRAADAPRFVAKALCYAIGRVTAIMRDLEAYQGTNALELYDDDFTERTHITRIKENAERITLSITSNRTAEQEERLKALIDAYWN